MKTSIILLMLIVIDVCSQSLAPVQPVFMQGNNINSVFMTNGTFNYDKTTFSGSTAGFIWPASSSQRLTAVYASGFWIGAKVGPQRQLRLAASVHNSHFSPGNIPVIGQVPPQSVCNDPSWRGYYVQLTDQTLFNGGIRYKTAGGRQYTFNYDAWANWPVSKGAPYVEVNGIPGYQPAWDGDRPGIGNGMTARPEELLYMVYMDYTNCSDSLHISQFTLPGNTPPLGVEVHQLTFNFNCPPLRDMYFMKYFVINKSSLTWDSTYITSWNDIDIGASNDDLAGCDTIRNLGFIYNYSNVDIEYGINPPAVGVRILQSPLLLTGNNQDTVKLPYDTLLGYKTTGMSGYNKFQNAAAECTGDPDDAIYAFNFMRGKDGCGNTLYNWVTGNPTTYRFSNAECFRIGWYDSVAQEKRTISNMGPVTMQSGDTHIVVMSYIITRDGSNNLQNICAVQSLSDSALKYYYNDFKTCMPIGIQPISSEIPQRYELLQNYPNPFNPITKLRFSIPLSRGVAGEAGRGV